MERDLYKNIGDIDVCIELNIYEVKVYIIFLTEVGFSLRREVSHLFTYQFKPKLPYLICCTLENIFYW